MPSVAGVTQEDVKAAFGAAAVNPRLWMLYAALTLVTRDWGA
eukprot:gene2397-6700_t